MTLKYPLPELLDDEQVALVLSAHKKQVDFIAEQQGIDGCDDIVLDLYSTKEEVYTRAREIAEEILKCISS